MNNFRISEYFLSDIFWRSILMESEVFLPKFKDFLVSDMEFEKLRGQAEYNTGTISPVTGWMLFSISYYFKFRRVLEVGTFIGKSSAYIARAMNCVDDECEIYTCDYSNDIKLPELYGNVKLHQFPKTSSTEMFSRVQGKFDAILIDGGLQPNDIKLMREVLSDSGIIILDDLEGTEKGLINAAKIRSTPGFSNYILIRCPSEHVVEKLGFFGRSVLGVLVPTSRISFTRQ